MALGINIPETFQRLTRTLPGKGDAKWCFYCMWGARISAQSKSLQERLPRRYRLAAPPPINWICRVSVPTPTRRRGTADVTADTERTESRFRASIFNRWTDQLNHFPSIPTQRTHLPQRQGNEWSHVHHLSSWTNFDRQFLLHGIIFVLCSKRRP